MIELIVVIMLSVRNGKRAREKGYGRVTFTVLTILLYFSSEFIGAIIGYILFQDRFPAYITGLLFGIAGGVTFSMIINSFSHKGVTR